MKNNSKKKNNFKKSIIKNGLFGLAILLLFLTGAHTEVFAFVQRGILKTGIMNPKVEQAMETSGIEQANSGTPTKTKADFNLQLMNENGERVNMKDFRGKAIFINVWATWCPPCIAEMPGINELYKDIKDENVEFIMLSVDQDFDKAIKFNQDKEFEFPIYRLAGAMPAMYASNAIPTTYVIDANGDLVLTHKGMGDFDTTQFREFMEEIQK